MSRHAAAIHEGGHAVVACATDAHVLCARINDAGGGVVMHIKSDQPVNEIAISLAGELAETRATGYGKASEHDIRGIRLALRGRERQADRLIREGYELAEKILDEKWGRVRAVADALAEHDRLSGDEVRAIFAAPERRRVRGYVIEVLN